MKLKDNINKARGNTSSLLLPPHKPIKEAVNQKLLLTLYRQYAQNFLKLSNINLGFITGNHNKLPACCWRAPSFIIISHSQRKEIPPTWDRCKAHYVFQEYQLLIIAYWFSYLQHPDIFCHSTDMYTAIPEFLTQPHLFYINGLAFLFTPRWKNK